MATAKKLPSGSWRVLVFSHYETYLRARMDDIRPYTLGGFTAQNVQGWINILSASYSPKYVRNAYGLFTAAVEFTGTTSRFGYPSPQSRNSTRMSRATRRCRP